MTASGSSDVRRVLVLCIQQEMGDAFLQDVAGEAVSGSAEVVIDQKTVHLDTLAGDPRMNQAWDDTVAGAGAMILLARFLDVISLDKIKAIYRRLPSDQSVPFAVLIHREQEEADFKMSCPACGQKLWVHDADVGKRGRCPNCKKAFKLPSQSILMRSQLMLPDMVRVDLVIKGNQAHCREALGNLIGEMTGELVAAAEALDPENLKKNTVRVQIQTEG